MRTANTVTTIWPDASALAHAAAHLIVDISNKAVQQKGYCSIALSGGSTPKLLFSLLAKSPYKNNIPWKKIYFAFGDERFVPPTSDDSNYKMAMDSMLSLVPVPKKNILAVETVKLKPEPSAKQYEKDLSAFVTKKNPFDLVLLGIGEEGHTASIFPNSPLLEDKKRVRSTWVEEKQMQRISFTLSFINQAKNIAFLVSGAGKSAILKTLRSAKGKKLPAARVQATKTTYWFLDEAAAGTE